jgi:hypothetical protein
MALSTMNAPSPALKDLIAILGIPLQRVFEGLQQVAKEAWGGITPKELQELVRSMKRCQAVIDARGMDTKIEIL